MFTFCFYIQVLNPSLISSTFSTKVSPSSCMFLTCNSLIAARFFNCGVVCVIVTQYSEAGALIDYTGVEKIAEKG